MHRLLYSTLVVLLVLPMRVHPQDAPDFSGTWTLDMARSESIKGIPWYQRHTYTLVIRKTATELRIEQIDGLPATYKLDGSESLKDEGGADTSPDWRRKTRTQLSWAGSTLITRTTPVREDIDRATGAVSTAVGVTRIEAHSLSPDGTRMIVETSGYRSKVPPTLHGLPYNPSTDPLLQKYTDVYSKIAP